MASSSTAWKKRIVTAVKCVVIAVVVWWVVMRLRSDWNELRDYAWDLHPGWLVLAGGIYAVGLLPAALFWRHLLHAMGQETRLATLLRAYFVGHLGKYVPGKALVVVIRTGLIRGPTVDTKVAASSVFLETLTMMASGAFIAAAIIAVKFQDQVFLLYVAVGLMIAAGLPTIPRCFRFLVRMAGVGKGDATIQARINDVGVSTLVRGWVAMLLSWVLLGASFWATLRAMGVTEADLLTDLPRYVASVSLAMVAGFLSLIPGGLGVREMVLSELMTPYLNGTSLALQGSIVAMISAVLLRFVWLITELVVSGLLYFGVRVPKPSEESVLSVVP